MYTEGSPRLGQKIKRKKTHWLAYILLRPGDLHISTLIPRGAAVHRMILIEFSLSKWSCPDVNLLWTWWQDGMSQSITSLRPWTLLLLPPLSKQITLDKSIYINPTLWYTTPYSPSKCLNQDSNEFASIFRYERT